MRLSGPGHRRGELTTGACEARYATLRSRGIGDVEHAMIAVAADAVEDAGAPARGTLAA